MLQALSQVSETKLKGLWYFDENSLPRPNLANPYNLEPKFYGHSTEPPVWDSSLNRWRVHNGLKLTLEIGNFLDFRPEQLIRTVSVVLDFRMITPLSGTIEMPGTWIPIATLSSDIEISLAYR